MPRGTTLRAGIVVLALALAPAAVAHDGGGARKGYSSTITAVEPATPGLTVLVLDADDRLRLTLEGDHTLVIDGYDGEPYLRFDRSGAYRNANSPATYLNDDRYGKVALPAGAAASAPATWVKLSDKAAYDWHDHRIHWMSEAYPPRIAADPSVAQKVFDWTVPGTLDGTAFRIVGRLDYAPPPDGGTPVWLVVGSAVVGAAGIALVVVRQRQLRRRTGEGDDPAEDA